jgi:tol-pal system protein YbgF
MTSHPRVVRVSLLALALLVSLAGCQETLQNGDQSFGAPAAPPVSQPVKVQTAQLVERFRDDIRSLGKNLSAFRRGLANQEERIEGVRKKLQHLVDLLEERRVKLELSSKNYEKQVIELRGRLEAMDNELSYLRFSGARGGSAADKEDPVEVIRPAGAPAGKTLSAVPLVGKAQNSVAVAAGAPAKFALVVGAPSGEPAKPVVILRPAGSPSAAGPVSRPPQPASDADFNEALRVLNKEKTYPKARMLLNQFILKNQTHELADDAQFWIGESYFAEKNFERAILAFNKVQVDYANGDKAPDALLKEALAFLSLGDKASARELMGRVVKKYPGSSAAAAAAKRLKSL